MAGQKRKVCAITQIQVAPLKIAFIYQLMVYTLWQKGHQKVSRKKNVYVRPGAVTSKVVRRHDLRWVLEGPAKCLIGSDFFFFLFFFLFILLYFQGSCLLTSAEKPRYRLEVTFHSDPW